MSAVSDNASNVSAENVEAAPQEQKTEQQAELLELGKVSDTRGGWIGVKADIGLGWTSY